MRMEEILPASRIRLVDEVADRQEAIRRLIAMLDADEVRVVQRLHFPRLYVLEISQSRCLAACQREGQKGYHQ